MGATNFARPINASKYFVVLTGAVEEFEITDFIDSITEEIVSSENGREDTTVFNDRNYNRSSLGALNVTKLYGDIEVNITVRAILQNGYHEGATLDYQVLIYDGTEDLEITDNYLFKCTIKEVMADLFEVQDSSVDSSEMNKGLRTIQAKNAEKFCKATISKLSQELEKIYENFTQHKLQCEGVFGNGEAIYSEIND